MTLRNAIYVIFAAKGGAGKLHHQTIHNLQMLQNMSFNWPIQKLIIQITSSESIYPEMTDLLISFPPKINNLKKNVNREVSIVYIKPAWFSDSRSFLRNELVFGGAFFNMLPIYQMRTIARRFLISLIILLFSWIPASFGFKDLPVTYRLSISYWICKRRRNRDLIYWYKC